MSSCPCWAYTTRWSGRLRDFGGVATISAAACLGRYAAQAVGEGSSLRNTVGAGCDWRSLIIEIFGEGNFNNEIPKLHHN
jgi:hypothetical protein